MSKPVKEMIIEDYRRKFGDVSGALVIDIRGIEANQNNEFRLDLRKKDIAVTVIRNALARKAFAETPLAGLGPVLEGPSALAFGGESVVDTARALVEWAKKIDELELKGAVLDGEFFEGDAGVRRLSEYPTKDEAKARVVQLVLTPAGNVVGAAKGPGGRVLGIVKQIEEMLEKGETIARSA
ncbi:MAG: 50S ribosomal protein L10 [Planctomycetota bacterium]|jgi:large subunit ribosomal protein L10